MKNKKAEIGMLTKIFVSVLVFAMSFMSLYFFYSDVVSDYKCEDGNPEQGCLNFTEPAGMENLTTQINWTISQGEDYTIERGQETFNFTAGSISSLLWDNAVMQGLKNIISFIGNIYELTTQPIAAIASALNIPTYWKTGFVAILIIIITILIIGGIIRATKW